MKNVLEERLIDFAVETMKVKSDLKKSYESTHLFQQLFQSSTSVPLNFAEALGGQTKKDFVHKLSICLKELRESQVNFRIIKKGNLSINNNFIDVLIDESNQLISIFTKCIETTKERSSDQFR